MALGARRIGEACLIGHMRFLTGGSDGGSEPPVFCVRYPGQRPENDPVGNALQDPLRAPENRRQAIDLTDFFEFFVLTKRNSGFICTVMTRRQDRQRQIQGRP